MTTSFEIIGQIDGIEIIATGQASVILPCFRSSSAMGSGGS
jgi:hypothetical protein